jgi:hypothetical protein
MAMAIACVARGGLYGRVRRMAATASGPRLTCRGCKGTIDIPGRRVGDAVDCPSCGIRNVILRSKTMGEVPPAIEQGGLSHDDRLEVQAALKRILTRRHGEAHGHVELYPNWAVFVAGVQFYLSAVMAGQNLIALGEERRGRKVQVVGVLAYVVAVSGVVALRVLLRDRLPDAVYQGLLAGIPLVAATWLTWTQAGPANAAREHGARNAPLLLPLLVGLMLAIAQGFALYFLFLRIYGHHLL